ncbi:hypothetical protein Raf01_28650 [Rugosimonospora africana]|uniref:Uncharacterized protein n=1 Tax=Rugosimonospora africana TaxID=556532 RepID=A0A8J3QS99_9ACTN|nr:hypothetical protein Raf01_28650 [Rugosimonospora africana]
MVTGSGHGVPTRAGSGPAGGAAAGPAAKRRQYGGGRAAIRRPFGDGPADAGILGAGLAGQWGRTRGAIGGPARPLLPTIQVARRLGGVNYRCERPRWASIVGQTGGGPGEEPE